MCRVVSLPVTVTIKEQVSVFVELSVAVHSTGVSPNGNADPDAGTQATVGAGSTASVAVGANVTLDDVVSPISVLAVIGAGGQSAITGDWSSTIPRKQFIKDQNTISISSIWIVIANVYKHSRSDSFVRFPYSFLT